MTRKEWLLAAGLSLFVLSYIVITVIQFIRWWRYF
jgi:hypothetical protein